MVIGIDLGGTKLWIGLFTEDGDCFQEERFRLDQREGDAVGTFICAKLQEIKEKNRQRISAVGVAVPGMYDPHCDTVWAPNIPGWEAYPLKAKLRESVGDIPISIEDDRTCSILGEVWQGKAKAAKNAVFITVGTGIGAGILSEGKIIRGSTGTAGAVGWMAMEDGYEELYRSFGCFESYSSGDGITRFARKLIGQTPEYSGMLRHTLPLDSAAIFKAAKKKDPIAMRVLTDCTASWGRAVANLVSILNPEVIIFGGGVFGPALDYLEEIEAEMLKWAQPLAGARVRLVGSALKGYACLYGAAWSAIQLSYQNNASIYA